MRKPSPTIWHHCATANGRSIASAHLEVPRKCCVISRATPTVAISNRRLIACDDKGVTFKWKDYRLEGCERYKVMTISIHEFIRRFLIHVLPAAFHRIPYDALLATPSRAANIARAPELLAMPLLPI